MNLKYPCENCPLRGDTTPDRNSTIILGEVEEDMGSVVTKSNLGILRDPEGNYSRAFYIDPEIFNDQGGDILLLRMVGCKGPVNLGEGTVACLALGSMCEERIQQLVPGHAEEEYNLKKMKGEL